jgi:hypothetical protein
MISRFDGYCRAKLIDHAVVLTHQQSLSIKELATSYCCPSHFARFFRPQDSQMKSPVFELPLLPEVAPTVVVAAAVVAVVVSNALNLKRCILFH